MPWIVPVASAVIGGVQAASASSKRKEAERELLSQANAFQPNASILDFYNKALSKYNPNPYQTVAYGQQKNQIDRNLATGLNASQNKRLGLGAVGGLVQQANDNAARAAGSAEASNRQDLGQLAEASRMKTNEQQKKFDMMYNLTAQKAGAYAQTQNTGLQNLYSGLSNAATLVGEYGWDGKKDPYSTNPYRVTR